MLNKLKPKSEFAKNVLTLMTGTTISQAIPIAISPILTRIYTPEDFGIFALFLSLVSIFSVVATGRYELAIMLPRKDENAVYIAMLAMIISLIFSILLFVLFWQFNQVITDILGNKEISIWLYWVPVSIFMTSVYQSLNYLNIRKKSYKYVAKSKILQSTALSVTSVTMGYTVMNKMGLIMGQMIGQFFSFTYLIYITYSNRIFIFKKFNKLKIWSLLKRYDEFPKIVTLTGILNVASAQAPIIILTSFFTLNIVGFYSFAYRILGLPITLLGTSIGQVFFQEMSQRRKMIARANLFKVTLEKLLKIASPIFTFIIMFGDKIFALIFGSEWIIAGEYAQIISLWLFFVFLVSPLTQVYNILEKQRLFLQLNLLGFLLRILSLFVGGLYFHDILLTLYLFVGSSVVTWILILGTMLSYLHLDKIYIFLNIFKYFLGYIIFFYLLKSFLGGFLLWH